MPALLAGCASPAAPGGEQVQTLRVGAVQAVGLAVLGGLIGAGGLGAVVFEGMAQRIIDSPALADYWRAVDSDVPSMRAARETVRDLLEEPIARAKAAGLCRDDLEKTDISLISGMLGAALRGKTRDERAQLAGRALQLLRGGLQGAASEAR